MTNEEIKAYLKSKEPVSYEGIEYAYIDEVRYRNDNGRLTISAVLKDKQANSITVAKAGKVEKA